MTIYFIREDAPDGRIKIGFTGRRALARLAALQTGNSRHLVLMATVRGGLRDEEALHRRFAAHRVAGEWFLPATELLDYIATLTGQEQDVGPCDALEGESISLFGISMDRFRALHRAFYQTNRLNQIEDICFDWAVSVSHDDKTDPTPYALRLNPLLAACTSNDVVESFVHRAWSGSIAADAEELLDIANRIVARCGSITNADSTTEVDVCR